MDYIYHPSALPFRRFTDGIAGKRWQLVYAGRNFKERRTKLLLLTRYVDAAFFYSSMAHIHNRCYRPRWVTDVFGRPLIMQLPQATQTKALVLEKEGQRPDRMYLIVEDLEQGTVFGELGQDDRPGIRNVHFNGPRFAWVGKEVFSPSPFSPGVDVSPRTATHEMAHAMGAVNRTAPDATQEGHQRRMSELMTATEGVSDFIQRPDRPSEWVEWRIDPDGDSHFHPSPPAGSYLATHWNVCLSPFLYRYLLPT